MMIGVDLFFIRLFYLKVSQYAALPVQNQVEHI